MALGGSLLLPTPASHTAPAAWTLAAQASRDDRPRSRGASSEQATDLLPRPTASCVIFFVTHERDGRGFILAAALDGSVFRLDAVPRRDTSATCAREALVDECSSTGPALRAFEATPPPPGPAMSVLAPPPMGRGWVADGSPMVPDGSPMGRR